jgi:uncharacterized cupredoxin-like copper-binding protein
MQSAFRWSRFRRLSAIVAGAVIVSACSTAATTQPSVASSSAPSAAAGSAGASTVAAKETEFKIDLSAATASPGSVTFQISNAGAVVHEFVVVKTDLAADKLPVDSSKGEVKEDDPSVTAIDEVEDIAIGATQSLTVDLPAGHYVVFCNVSGHYPSGMRADFTTQ